MLAKLLLLLVILYLVFSEIGSNLAGTFTAAKSATNDALCAFKLNPVSSLPKVSLLQCISYCQRIACKGINYFDNGNGNGMCLTYSTSPTLYIIKSGCKYYSSGVSAAKGFIVNETNVALGRPAYMMTLYYSDPTWVLIESNTNRACTLNYGGNPWWAVELVQTNRIAAVKVTTQEFGARYANRLDNFFVKLSNTQPVVGYSLIESVVTVCGQYNGRPPGGMYATGIVTCRPGLAKFKYVIVQGLSDALCLLIVEVFTAIE